MERIDKLEQWGETHYVKFFTALRIILGLIILSKGIYFIQNTEIIHQMLANSRIEFLTFMIVHYVAMGHLVGGPLISLGLITRIAIIFQLPVLIGAIVFINAPAAMMAASELWLSILVLLLLIFFLVYGSGPVSVDHYMGHKPAATGEDMNETRS